LLSLDDDGLVVEGTSTSMAAAPKLLDRVRAAIRARHYSRRTDLAVARHVAASTQNQALSALLFLYRTVLATDVGVVEHVIRARVPVKVPVVLSVEEVRAVMAHMKGVSWLVVALLYGAGRDCRKAWSCVSRTRLRQKRARRAARQGSKGGECPVVWWDHQGDDTQRPQRAGTSFRDWLSADVRERAAETTWSYLRGLTSRLRAARSFARDVMRARAK